MNYTVKIILSKGNPIKYPVRLIHEMRNPIRAHPATSIIMGMIRTGTSFVVHRNWKRKGRFDKSLSVLGYGYFRDLK